MNSLGKRTPTNNQSLHRPNALFMLLKVEGVSENFHNYSISQHNMKQPVTRPQLHLGLTSGTDDRASAWFLAVLPESSKLDGSVTIHFGLVGVGPVLLPLFFLRSTRGQQNILLETSLNPYQADLEGLKLLRCLGTQASYHIHCRELVTNSEQILEVPNIHQSKYQQAVKVLEAHPPWTATQFVQAQFHLARSWTTPEERYKNLQCPPAKSNS